MQNQEQDNVQVKILTLMLIYSELVDANCDDATVREGSKYGEERLAFVGALES